MGKPGWPLSAFYTGIHRQETNRIDAQVIQLRWIKTQSVYGAHKNLLSLLMTTIVRPEM